MILTSLQTVVFVKKKLLVRLLEGRRTSLLHIFIFFWMDYKNQEEKNWVILCYPFETYFGTFSYIKQIFSL